ncbi:MAG: hypothetical protein ACD_59C00130G0008 [uncultured bacterium]|nr:MAG: hypothetical protein ACD_59C00130G0008 [uncultured bacterium]
MINKILEVYKKNGFLGTLKKNPLKLKSIFLNIPYYCYRIKYIYEPEYKNSDDSDLTLIEKIFRKENILLYDYFVDTELFRQFKKQIGFPCDYHGGHESGVYEEKILEHYIVYDLLNLKSYSKNEIYIDVAAASSP